MRLRLDTIDNTKRTYQRLLSAYAAGKLDPDLYRGLIYGMSGYLNLLKIESDIVAADALKQAEALLSESSGA